MPIKFIRQIKPFNRRKQVRLDVLCLAKYKETEGPAKGKWMHVNVLNVSEGGIMFAAFNRKFEPKTKIDIEIELSNSGKPIYVEAEVRQIYPAMERISKIGVKFLNLKKDDLEVIKEFIKIHSAPKKD